jgi:hypothetical protein
MKACRRPSVASTVTSIVALTVSAAAGAGPFAATADAQVIAQCPDPTMLYASSRPATFTLMCTGHGFPTRSARRIAGLSRARPHPAFARDGWPRWAVRGFWAPDLQQVGDSYRLYFSAQRKGDHRRCIGVAISDGPSGGFRDIGHPLLANDRDGAIDPTLLRAQRRLYILYKRDGNAFGRASTIYGRRLDRSGLEVVGPRKVLLRSQSDGWEGGVVEGPTAVSVGKTTWLLFSGGYYLGSGYGEGEAVRHGTPLGLYHRAHNNPVLIGGGNWVGTGGGSVFSAHGIFLFAYNAFPPNEHPGQRRLFLKELGLVGGVLRPVGQVRPLPLVG